MSSSTRPADGLRPDGIVCFGGEDWWYHNRGHYDMQMMRELSRQFPVLYINSIGMRVPHPREGRIFLQRIGRKLRSLARGLRRVDEGFHVTTLASVPGLSGTAWRRLQAGRVGRLCRRLGIQRPLVWIACPPAVEIAAFLPASAVIYQRTDRMEHFPGVNEARIRAFDRAAKHRADLTLFASTLLYEQERAECRRAAYVDHGVDYERFAEAARHPRVPADMAGIRRPIVGFVGGIDEHTFDPQLFVHVASELPDCSFALVGASSLPDGWCTLPNVHFLGRKDYPEVPHYMAACDVLIMPWRDNEWIRACNPVKLKEYLAVGRPVVSTDFPELARYSDRVLAARSREEFSTKIRTALLAPPNAEIIRSAIREETWSSKSERVLEALLLEPRETRKGYAAG